MPTAVGSCPTSGNRCTPTLLRSWFGHLRAYSAGMAMTTACPRLGDCPGPGMRSRLGISWSARRPFGTGGWEAIVLDRSEETFTLQYRDYPHLPRFVRRRSGIALMCPADNGQSWNEITAGHLVIAQESAKEGWWEAIVIDRKADSLTLQFRDYPNLPKIVRHRSAIALMYRANEAHESEAGAQQA